MRRRGLIALAALAGFVTVAVAVATGWEPLGTVDDHVLSSLDNFGSAHPIWVRGWEVVSVVLQPNVWRTAAIVIAVLLVSTGRRRAGAFLAGVAILTVIVSIVFKPLVNRARPTPFHGAPHAAGQSFPSGHALTAAALTLAFIVTALALGRLTTRRSRVAAIACGIATVALVSFSRLALGVHYLSDIVAALLLGLGSVVSLAWASRVRCGSGDR